MRSAVIIPALIYFVFCCISDSVLQKEDRLLPSDSSLSQCHQEVIMPCTVFTTPFISKVFRRLSIVILYISGWRTEGKIPSSIKKCVVIAAPHTTNWDFPIMLMTAFALKINVFWMGKHTIFRFPFGWLMKWLGGIPIDRRHRNDTVVTTIEIFRSTDSELRLAIAPEGTRTRGGTWKTGFYHIADGAGVPIVLATIDYHRKTCGIRGIFFPTGDAESDIKKIKERYAQFLL